MGEGSYEDQAERARQLMERRLKVLEMKLKLTQYCKFQNENKQNSCCICFEEFNEDSMVR